MRDGCWRLAVLPKSVGVIHKAEICNNVLLEVMMADNPLLLEDDDDVGGDDDIFVYTGGEQEVPSDVKRVRIAENVDTILARAFRNCQQLIEVEGHSKIKKIERNAFSGCHRLRRVTKMHGLIEIGDFAFFHCYALSELELDKLEIIGNFAFVKCNSLRSVNMPSIKKVKNSAFDSCDALTDAVFGKDLERIEGGTFQGALWGCTALRRIVIPLKDNLIIEDNAFNNCSNLSRVDILDGKIHRTISSLHLESWRDDMHEEIDRIDQTLPNTGAYEKAGAIRTWIARVISRMEHYKSEHKALVKEPMTLLELALWKANLENEANDAAAAKEVGVRVTRGQRKRKRKDRCITSGASIVIKNVLPFLALK